MCHGCIEYYKAVLPALSCEVAVRVDIKQRNGAKLPWNNVAEDVIGNTYGNMQREILMCVNSGVRNQLNKYLNYFLNRM